MVIFFVLLTSVSLPNLFDKHDYEPAYDSTPTLEPYHTLNHDNQFSSMMGHHLKKYLEMSEFRTRETDKSVWRTLRQIQTTMDYILITKPPNAKAERRSPVSHALFQQERP